LTTPTKPLKGRMRAVVAYMQQHPGPLNTHDLMEQLKLENRGVASTMCDLRARGLVTKRTVPAMIEGFGGRLHPAKLCVFELTAAGKQENTQ